MVFHGDQIDTGYYNPPINFQIRVALGCLGASLKGMGPQRDATNFTQVLSSPAPPV